MITSDADENEQSEFGILFPQPRTMTGVYTGGCLPIGILNTSIRQINGRDLDYLTFLSCSSQIV
jgi:hypothetical protein